MARGRVRDKICRYGHKHRSNASYIRCHRKQLLVIGKVEDSKAVMIDFNPVNAIDRN